MRETHPLPAPLTHSFTPLEVASLAAAGATPAQLRAILSTYTTLADYTSDAAAHATRKLPTLTPQNPHLPADAWLLALGAPGYPDLLATAPHPPILLYGKGDPAALVPGIAIVGTRNMTEFGRIVAITAAHAAAAIPAPIHSGLALGVDATAHVAALAARARTVAVLACGIDQVYPSTHTALAEQILSHGGALITEQPPGTKALPRHLMARNRIIVGLSTVVVPCELALRSGTMHSVSVALTAHRSLIVALPRPSARDLPSVAGVMALASQEATPIPPLGLSAPAAAIAATRTPIADAVAQDRTELGELIAVAHRFGLPQHPLEQPPSS